MYLDIASLIFVIGAGSVISLLPKLVIGLLAAFGPINAIVAFFA